MILVEFMWVGGFPAINTFHYSLIIIEQYSDLWWLEVMTVEVQLNVIHRNSTFDQIWLMISVLKLKIIIELNTNFRWLELIQV